MSQIIKINNLTRRFKNLTAVDSVTFSVNEGEIFGLLGPNGAGKSTTIKMLCTILGPTCGEAMVSSYNVAQAPHNIRKEIGIVFQDPSLDDRLTAEDNLLFYGYMYYLNKKEIYIRIKELLNLVGLYDRRKELVRKYSGGMKRRLEIARGLMHRPKILFLDEPTLGLDPQTRSHIWAYVLKMREETGLTIFMTTHYMEEAEICDRIAIIDHGKIIDIETPVNLKNKYGESTLEGVFLKLTGKEIR